MPQITLTREQVQQIADLCAKHGQTKWFMAKDEGAYIGACGGSHEDKTFENVIFYFRGMNPKKEAYAGEAWDNARDAFGGDDFGEHFEVSILTKLLADETFVKLVFKADYNGMSISSKHRKAAPKPAAPKPTAKPATKPATAKGKTKGEQIRHLLEAGVSVEAIVKMVGTTANSVRWHKSKMNKAA